MINIGIIGAGRIGKVHGESINKYVKGARVKSIYNFTLDNEILAWANEMGINEVYDDYKKILNDKEIDAVLICTSTDTHASISIEAIRAGKHVFCEKPIDHDIEKIKNVMLELDNSDIKYQVGFNRRFDHNFMAIKEAIKSGKIGDINIIKITSRDPEAPPVSYIKVSGGMFLDMTIHDFDMVRYLSESEVEEVYAIGAVLVNEEIGQAGDIDTAIITMKLSNGSLAVIDNSREACYGYDQRAEVFGSKGCISVGNDSNSTAILSNKDGVIGEKPLYFFLQRYMQAYANEVSQFVDAIVNDTEVPVGIVDGLNPVIIGLAAQRSLKEQRPVKISEISL